MHPFIGQKILQKTKIKGPKIAGSSSELEIFNKD